MYAPFRFLLSPEFLVSDRARVAVYALSQITPWLPQVKMFQLIDSILESPDRKKIKVTAFKELYRLLAANPIPEHLNIILREWSAAAFG